LEVTPKHSPLGASICHRWWECPGSVALSAKMPEQETSFPAAEGTVAHNVAEEALKQMKKGKKFDIYSQIGNTYMEGDHEIEVTEEMCEAVIVYLDEIKRETHRFGTGWNFLSIEHPFNLRADKEAWGTNDASLYKPYDFVHVWDYKHGQGIVVDVENNKQLMYYALGAIQGKDVDRVITTIVQPRAYHPDGVVRSCEYTVSELLHFEDNLKKRIAATRKPDAPLKAGSHCKFCPALGDCPEVRAETNQVAKHAFESVQLNTSDQMVKLLEMTPRIVDFLKENEKQVKIKAERGEEISGFKLVKAKSNRIWRNENSVINKFRPVLGDSMFGKLKLLSPAQLEKLGKDLLKKDELLPFIDKPDKGLSLVADSDPRKAVDGVSPQEAFKDV
jgi:hypothetical protein